MSQEDKGVKKGAGLDKRLRVQIKIALLRDCVGDFPEQDVEARENGLTGAEVDALREGRAFDIKVLAAVKLGCAVHSGRFGEINPLIGQARMVGFSDDECDEICEIAKNL